MHALIGWGLHHILLFSFLVIFQFQGGCIAFCQCVWGSDKQNLVEKSTKDATEIDGTLFKRKLLSFYQFNWINLVNFLLILIQVITAIIQTMHSAFLIYRIYNRIWKYLNSYTETVICLRLSEHFWIIPSTLSLRLLKVFTSSSVNNC